MNSTEQYGLEEVMIAMKKALLDYEKSDAIEWNQTLVFKKVSESSTCT